jgi:hypothetical protein
MEPCCQVPIRLLGMVIGYWAFCLYFALLATERFGNLKKMYLFGKVSPNSELRIYFTGANLMVDQKLSRNLPYDYWPIVRSIRSLICIQLDPRPAGLCSLIQGDYGGVTAVQPPSKLTPPITPHMLLAGEAGRPLRFT